MSNHLATLTCTNSDFKNLLDVLINREGSRRLTLDAFLTAPMQRITKLPLLMRTILDKVEDGTEEHAQCKEAFEAASKIATVCDEVVEEKKKLEALLLVSKELEFADATKSIPIVHPQRSLTSRANVHHFAFLDRATKKEKLHLILFSDLLLVTKKKSDKLFTVVDYCYRDKVYIKEMESMSLYGQGDNAKQQKPVVITMLNNSQNKKLDLVVTFKEQNICKDWKQLLENGEVLDIEDCVQFVALETHEANAADEISFTKGDIIQAATPEIEGWCLGELLKDGTKGRFPVEKTTKIPSSRLKADNKKNIKDRMSKELEDGALTNLFKEETNEKEKEIIAEEPEVVGINELICEAPNEEKESTPQDAIIF